MAKQKVTYEDIERKRESLKKGEITEEEYRHWFFNEIEYGQEWKIKSEEGVIRTMDHPNEGLPIYKGEQ